MNERIFCAKNQIKIRKINHTHLRIRDEWVGGEGNVRNAIMRSRAGLKPAS